MNVVINWYLILSYVNLVHPHLDLQTAVHPSGLRASLIQASLIQASPTSLIGTSKYGMLVQLIIFIIKKKDKLHCL